MKNVKSMTLIAAAALLSLGGATAFAGIDECSPHVTIKNKSKTKQVIQVFELKYKLGNQVHKEDLSNKEPAYNKDHDYGRERFNELAVGVQPKYVEVGYRELEDGGMIQKFGKEKYQKFYPPKCQEKADWKFCIDDKDGSACGAKYIPGVKTSGSSSSSSSSSAPKASSSSSGSNGNCNCDCKKNSDD